MRTVIAIGCMVAALPLFGQMTTTTATTTTATTTTKKTTTSSRPAASRATR